MIHKNIMALNIILLYHQMLHSDVCPFSLFYVCGMLFFCSLEFVRLFSQIGVRFEVWMSVCKQTDTWLMKHSAVIVHVWIDAKVSEVISLDNFADFINLYYLKELLTNSSITYRIPLKFYCSFNIILLTLWCTSY